MHAVRQEDLPFVGMSHQFVGADHGDVAVSVYLVNAPPGRGPGPHRHPYDEIAFIQKGRGRWIVNGEAREAGAGDILVVKAGEIHSLQISVRSPWCSSTFTSARGSFKKT